MNKKKFDQFIQDKLEMYGSYQYIADRIQSWEKTKLKTNEKDKDSVYLKLLVEWFKTGFDIVYDNEGKLFASAEKNGHALSLPKALKVVRGLDNYSFKPTKKGYYSWLNEKGIVVENDKDYTQRLSYLLEHSKDYIMSEIEVEIVSK